VAHHQAQEQLLSTQTPLAKVFAELARGTRRFSPCFADPLAAEIWDDVEFSLQASRLCSSRTFIRLSAIGPQAPPDGGSGFIGIACDSACTRYCPARIAAPPSLRCPPFGKRGGTGSGQSVRGGFDGIQRPFCKFADQKKKPKAEPAKRMWRAPELRRRSRPTRDSRW